MWGDPGPRGVGLGLDIHVALGNQHGRRAACDYNLEV